ncbi:MAG: alpha/beta hydrolase [Calditrichaeota bacterium]|nr:alpha/beta hydrolase [Calditrichota bacterium]
MLEIPTVFYSDGHQLVGIRHYPEKPTEKVVVMCHGYTSHKGENKRLFVEMAREFARNGTMAFRFDFFGSGDSEGEFRETRVSQNIQNLKDALSTVRKMGFTKIFVLGISMGAATAILTLASEAADGLILWSTLPDFRKLFEVYTNGQLEGALKKVDVIEHEGWLVERGFILEALSFDIQKSFARLTLPKLIVQGDQDEPLFREGFEAFKKIASGPAKFVKIPGANHTYDTVQHRKQVISETMNWFREIA